MSKKNKQKLEIRIEYIDKLSFNKYTGLHWGEKKKFKDKLKEQFITQTKNRIHLDGGYNLSFKFYFIGRKIDTINCVHYIKKLEDTIFKQDKDNGWIKLQTFKSQEDYNYVDIILEKIDEI